MMLKLMFLLSALLGSQAIKMAKLYRSSGPTMTSSTLGWESVSAGDNPPPNSVEVVDGGPIWCRILEKTVYVPGAVVDGRCRVPFFGVHKKANYEVLVSINGAAGLLREPWDFQKAIPRNAVVTPRMLMAYAEEADEILVGYIDPKQSSKRAFYAQGNEVVNKTKGVILVEADPKSYNLTNIVWNSSHFELVEREFEVVALKNPDFMAQNVTLKVSYKDINEVYWGKAQGCISGLPTYVSTPGESYNIVWGVPQNFNRRQSYTITHLLPSRSIINVTVYGILKSTPGVPYKALLVTSYKDLSPLSRNITGNYDSLRFLELRANYSQPLSITDQTYIRDGLPVTKILIPSTTMSPRAEFVDDGGGGIKAGGTACNVVYLLTLISLMHCVFHI